MLQSAFLFLKVPLMPITFFLICFQTLFSQVFIQGKAPSFTGKEMKLYCYKDYITKTKYLLETTTVNGAGDFTLRLDENTAVHTFYGILKCENFAATLHFEPGTDYEIVFSKPDSMQFPDDRVNFIEAEIVRPQNDLNASIRKFNVLYESFIKKNYTLFLQRAAKAEVDSFKMKTSQEFNASKNSFLEKYIKYSFASLDLIATANRQKIYADYLASAPLDYYNDSYMMFFDEFYHKQFFSFSDPQLRETVLASVNVQKSYASAMVSLAREKLLADEKIREMVLMKELFDNYNHPELDKKSIHLVLRELVKNSPVSEHREIAMNILSETGKIGVGAKAPDFSLYDKNQNIVKLSDFKGKYVYLDFWATWCVPCIKEMPLMAELKKKYAKEVVFISISVDKDLKTMQKFLSKKKDFDWVFLHYGNMPEIKEMYNVQGIPVYFLIDPDGIIVQSPAYRPSGKIEETFLNISSGKKSRRKAYEWDW